MDSNRFNQILVIDSIPVGHPNTAKRLFEDIETYASAYSPSPAVRYLRIESSNEFIQCILKCRQDADEQDVIPMLHIECHGDEDGFEFADGSDIDWETLKPFITELNIATRLNLIIAVAACTGGALAKTINLNDRAPFWGLIGPTKTIQPRELEKAYSALYLTLLSTKSPAKAVQAMDAATISGLFWRTTSQGLFEEVWNGYKKKCCNAEALEVRAKRMKQRLELSPDAPQPTTEALKSLLINREPEVFEQFKTTFFMCDLFPEHSTRFPIKYAP